MICSHLFKKRTHRCIQAIKLVSKPAQRLCSNNNPNNKNNNIVTLSNINTHGSLVMRCPSVNAQIRCINPHEVPNGDKSFLGLLTPEGSPHRLDLHSHFNIHYDKTTSVIHITLPEDELDGDVPCIHIEVPHVYNLDIEAANVHVVETEGDEINVNARSDCILGKIKALRADIVCGGSLDCNNLYGDGKVEAGGSISMKKLQSKKIDVQAESIDISAAYCLDFTCNTDTYAIKIGDLHGVAQITTNSGDVTVGSLDGDLNVTTKRGNVDVTVEKCNHVNVSTVDGDIEIGVGDNLSAFLEASGAHIDVPEDLLTDGMKYHTSSGAQTFEGRLGAGFVGSIVSKTQHGTVSFARKSWFSKFQFAD